MLIEGKTQLWFKFDPSNRFIKDFYKVWDSEVFFLAIEDSLLINLYYSNKNYFKIPAAKTRMKKDVYFLFDVVTDVWICVNKVDSFFESFFATNPLSSCFMISDNRQTKTV
ncbi:DUF5960 family protein [Enterococcus faecium]